MLKPLSLREKERVLNFSWRPPQGSDTTAFGGAHDLLLAVW